MNVPSNFVKVDDALILAHCDCDDDFSTMLDRGGDMFESVDDGSDKCKKCGYWKWHYTGNPAI